MATEVRTRRAYPRTMKMDGHEITLRLMNAGDAAHFLAFSKSLPREDLLYLRMDITQPDVVEEWIQNIARGRTVTVLAEEDGRVVGYGSLHHNEKMWTRHLGEIRLFVKSELRGIGLGERLAVEMMELAHERKLERAIINIPRTQPHQRKMMEKLGFTAEALLTDWLMDHDGRTHDLIIMSHRLDE